MIALDMMYLVVVQRPPIARGAQLGITIPKLCRDSGELRFVAAHPRSNPNDCSVTKVNDDSFLADYVRVDDVLCFVDGAFPKQVEPHVRLRIPPIDAVRGGSQRDW